jgi:flagellar hook-basal body complex protein FliE
MSSINIVTNGSLMPEIPAAASRNKDATGFGDRIKEALNDANSIQLNAADLADQFSRGEIENVHDVMIAAEKASVSLEMVTEVRNKLLDAYREIMKTQM